jgi:hypothetical protein
MSARPLPAHEGRAVRRAGAFALALLAAFLVLLVLSARAYAGGSWADPAADGFRPFVNYWCDLMRAEGMNGAPNGTAAALAKGAFCALALSLAAYWRVAASLLPSPRAARWGVVCGTLASAGVVLVAALPHDSQRWGHSVSTLAAGGFGFLAVLVLVAGGLHAAPRLRWRHVWGAALLAAAVSNLGIYADLVLRGDRDSALLPAVQECATLFLVLWMVATLLDARALAAGEAAS